MRLRRSPRELADRALQELRNMALFLHAPKPRLALPASPLLGLPDPKTVADRLRGTEYAQEVARLASEILAETGPDLAWRRDYLNGKETGTQYFRLIPYLDVTRAGDHKIIWEINRHQHLVLLAQAFVLDGETGHLKAIQDQLQSWFAANPFQRGINWASALEVAFRALSWIWIYHLAGNRFDPDFRREFLQWLYWHGRHLEVNLSFYFSPNTHLLGEAVALHALGRLFPEFPEAERWRELGGRVVREQFAAQVRPDGGHFEQSTYYHVYALDMFRCHALFEPLDVDAMVLFLETVMGPARRLAFFGDDDGGRFFHPYGDRAEFGRATLATSGVAADERDLHVQAAWWLGDEAFQQHRPPAPRSHTFPDTGLAVIVDGGVHIVFDMGPFGPWGSGHSHSDTLSLTLRLGEEEILIDPGTYTYVGDPAERDWFRGSAAHNTIRIDGRDQAVPAGPFRWTDQPQVRIVGENSAECSYAGFTHRRTLRLEPGLLIVEDEVTGPPGEHTSEHTLEQFWHLGSEAAAARFTLDGEAQQIPSWASSTLGEKHPAPALRLVRKSSLPQRFLTQIRL